MVGNVWMFINKHLRKPQLHGVYEAEMQSTSKTKVAGLGYCILIQLSSYENQSPDAGVLARHSLIQGIGTLV